MIPALDPTPESVAGRLAGLGLTVQDLLVPVTAGARARRTATENHPKSYGGWLDYGERVAWLRDGLCARGWIRGEWRSLPTVENREGTLAIMTALGDSATGTAAEVTTRRARGEVTRNLVQVNGDQYEFELGLRQQSVAVADRHARRLMPTWMLLVNAEGNEVRSELSLPRDMDADGYVTTWIDRIPLPVVRLNEPVQDDEGDEEAPADFEVAVHPRQ